MPTSLLAIATKALEENYFFQVPDTEASTFEEPGARKRHAGICAGAVRATGRPTAMAYSSLPIESETPTLPYCKLTPECRRFCGWVRIGSSSMRVIDRSQRTFTLNAMT